MSTCHKCGLPALSDGKGGKGGDFNGPVIKSLLSNESRLKELEDLLPSDLHIVVKHMKNIWRLNNIATMTYCDR